MGVAVPQALVGGWGAGPPQNFVHGSLFVGKLLYRKQVSQIIQADPLSPPPLKLLRNFLAILAPYKEVLLFLKELLAILTLMLGTSWILGSFSLYFSSFP